MLSTTLFHRFQAGGGRRFSSESNDRLTSGCSLPGALGMYGLAVGIQRVEDTLPAPVYALITGLNAATVGIIALAAVQLSQKAIKDTLTRILVFAGATAGMLYNALWYFPVLLICGGLATLIWDFRRSIIGVFHKRNADEEADAVGERDRVREELHDMPQTSGGGHSRATSTHSCRASTASGERRSPDESGNTPIHQEAAENRSSNVSWTSSNWIFSWKIGLGVAICFFITFTPIMVVRGVLDNAPRGFSLFANMYLAGTIIFGGGPVVIPLLRE